MSLKINRWKKKLNRGQFDTWNRSLFLKQMKITRELYGEPINFAKTVYDESSYSYYIYLI